MQRTARQLDLSGVSDTPPPGAAGAGQPSAWRAWGYLVWLSWLRQAPLPGLRLGWVRPAHVRQAVWIAFTLLIFSAVFVAINTALDRWHMTGWRYPRRGGLTFGEWGEWAQALLAILPRPFQAGAPDQAVVAAYQALLSRSDFLVFVHGIVLGLFLGFLLPVWSLSFATEALGGERDSRSLIWLLTRPLSRPAIYLARYLAVLPWCLALNLGGFALLCWLGGEPGRLSLRLFWPAIVWATLAFTALFHLMGAVFRRPAVVAALYVFFLEIILGMMPGYLKRISISYYARCLMYEAGAGHGLQPERPEVFLAVGAATATTLLVALTLGLLALGMALFSRMEYHEGV